MVFYNNGRKGELAEHFLFLSMFPIDVRRQGLQSFNSMPFQLASEMPVRGFAKKD